MYQNALYKKLLAPGATMTAPILGKGDVIIWSTLTPHGSLPSWPPDQSRLSLQGIYYPVDLPWGAYIYESGKHIYGPAMREPITINDAFLVAPQSGLRWL
jgi:hypothetical protein